MQPLAFPLDPVPLQRGIYQSLCSVLEWQKQSPLTGGRLALNLHFGYGHLHNQLQTPPQNIYYVESNFSGFPSNYRHLRKGEGRWQRS